MKTGRWFTVVGVATAVSLAVTGLGSVAAEEIPLVDETSDSDLLARTLAEDAAWIIGGEFERQAAPTATAIINGPIAGMPTDGQSGLLLSTGFAESISLPNDTTNTSAALSDAPGRGSSDRDVTVLRIDLQVPPNINCLTGLNFRFLSEEFPEYVGGRYNDAFIVELDNSTWTTSGSEIDAPQNFAFAPDGGPITINTAGATSMSAAEAEGTTFDGATPILTAATPLTPGAHSLYLSIFDQGDNSYDSAVLVDGLSIARVDDVATDCVPGAEVIDQTAYVALGDSFQSGEGDYANYEPDTDTDGNYCHRSRTAYPRLLVEREVVDLDLKFEACSGALIGDLTQKTVETGEAPWNEGPQLDSLGDDTRLVTVGIGGNDAGFEKVISDCVYSAWVFWNVWNICENNQQVEVDAGLESLDEGEISRELRALYREIRERAPYARIVVVSYPKFFPKDGIGIPISCSLVRVGDQQWLNTVVKRADASIKKAATSVGFEYVDMWDVMKGHEMCTPEPGMRPVSHFSPTKGIATPESFHPNAEGHVMMADKIEATLAGTVAPTFVIRQLERVTRSLAVGGSELHVNTEWPGSDVETTLISPSGIRYDRDNLHDAKHGNGPTYEYWDLSGAENGEWTIEVFGADVAADGEPVVFSATTAIPGNAAPTAAFSASGSGLTYSFDASASIDSDGTVDDYFWDFGDGTFATGITVSHVFPAGNEYAVVLRVTDNDGAEDYTSSTSAIGSVGQYIASSVSLTSAVTLAGPLHIHGDFSCATSSKVTGDLIVSGNVYMTNTCGVTGNVYAGGNIVMDAQPTVGGNVFARGNATFQSTAKIGGSLYSGGTFTSPEGKPIDYFTANGSVGGEILPAFDVPEMNVGAFGAVVAQTADYPAFTQKTWTQWMNETAESNNAAPGTPGTSANPGCVMAPWASSANGTTVHVSTDTVIDAQTGNCSKVSLQGMRLTLAADLTLFAKSFASVGGLTVTSSDGVAHSLNVVIPGARDCAASKTADLSAGTTTDALTSINLDVAGRIKVTGASSIGGKMDSGCLTLTGTVRVG